MVGRSHFLFETPFSTGGPEDGGDKLESLVRQEVVGDTPSSEDFLGKYFLYCLSRSFLQGVKLYPASVVVHEY